MQQLVDARLDLGFARPLVARPHAQPEAGIFGDSHMLEERVMLEDEADAAFAQFLAAHILIVEEDRSLILGVEAGQDAEQSRLAGARWAEQCDELALRDANIDTAQCREGAKGLVDALRLQAHDLSPARVNGPDRR